MVSSDGPFCCSGCASVFTILQTRGFGGYYACRVPPGVSQRTRESRADDHFAILDEADTAREFLLSLSADQARAIFRVPGLHCASCVWLVEQLWRVVPGVAKSEVDLMRRTVRIDFDPAATSLRRIAEALTAIGYEPSLDPETQAQRSGIRRTLLLKIGLAGFAFGNVMIFSFPQYLSGKPVEAPFRQLFDSLNLALSVVVLLYSASDYFRGAWAALSRRGITLDVPVALGLAVMFVRSTADIAAGTGTGYFDSFTGLVFFLLIGKLFQEKAFDAIAFDRGVRSFLPLYARVMRDGVLVTRPIQDIAPGDTVHVRPNEVVPADAWLLDDHAEVDQAFITGESEPIAVARGEMVRAGARIVGRGARLTAQRPASQSTLVELWAHPVLQRTKAHWLADVAARFGAWFTLIAVGLAVAGAVAWWPDVRLSLEVATAVLIIACPCALTLAAPITLGTAAGVLGRAGCYLKSPAVALDLSRINHVAFDKTGTLTATERTTDIERDGLTPAEWHLIRSLASHSTHPVSRALAEAPTTAPSDLLVRSVTEVAGQGIAGRVGRHQVAIGRPEFVAAQAGVTRSTLPPAGDLLGWTLAAVDGRVGRFRLTHATRPGVEGMLARLGRRFRLSLLSGDHARHADLWRGWFREPTFDQSPADKLTAVKAAQDRGDHVLMVGDGLNDTGAFAAADVGMAVSDDTACLVPACDVVIQGHQLTSLPAFLTYARRARHVIVLCFLVSIAYNVLGLTLALRGDLTPLVTAILMPVSSLTIIGLSVGLMRWRAPGGTAA